MQAFRNPVSSSRPRREKSTETLVLAQTYSVVDAVPLPDKGLGRPKEVGTCADQFRDREEQAAWSVTGLPMFCSKFLPRPVSAGPVPRSLPRPALEPPRQTSGCPSRQRRGGGFRSIHSLYFCT